MSLEKIHLRKLLKILFLPAKKRRSELRKDIREEINRKAGADVGGGISTLLFGRTLRLTSSDLSICMMQLMRGLLSTGVEIIYILVCERAFFSGGTSGVDGPTSRFAWAEH